MKKLTLIDTSNILFRSHFGLPPLTTSTGQNTGALLGLARTLLKLLDEKPSLIACAVEGGNSFRKKLYPQYKAHRTEIDPALVEQRQFVEPLIKALGVPVIKIDSFEADDVIGTLAKIGSSLKYKVEIISSDKDFCQLVDENTQIRDLAKNAIIGEEEVISKYGVAPKQFRDYLSIVGDKSDNIPGIRGLGPKNAARLLQEYQTVDNVVDDIESIEGKMRFQILRDLDSLRMSQKLATIVTDAVMPEPLEILCQRQPFDKSSLEKIIDQLEFSSLDYLVRPVYGVREVSLFD
jgi:DNA polymerase-1